MDVDRARERAVAERHHDRRAHRGGDVDDLRHQCQALRRGRGHRPRAGDGGGDRGTHRRVLGLDVDHLSVCPAVGERLRVALDDRGLRRDRVDREDVRVDLAHGLDDRLAAGQELCAGQVSRHRAPSRSRRWGRRLRRARSPCSGRGRSRRKPCRRASRRSRGSRASRAGSRRRRRGRPRAGGPVRHSPVSGWTARSRMTTPPGSRSNQGFRPGMSPPPRRAGPPRGQPPAGPGLPSCRVPRTAAATRLSSGGSPRQLCDRAEHDQVDRLGGEPVGRHAHGAGDLLVGVDEQQPVRLRALRRRRARARAKGRGRRPHPAPRSSRVAGSAGRRTAYTRASASRDVRVRTRGMPERSCPRGGGRRRAAARPSSRPGRPSRASGSPSRHRPQIECRRCARRSCSRARPRRPWRRR